MEAPKIKPSLVMGRSERFVWLGLALYALVIPTFVWHLTLLFIIWLVLGALVGVAALSHARSSRFGLMLATLSDGVPTAVPPSFVDPLTGLHNHRALKEFLRSELAMAGKQGLSVSAIVLDIDHFREFNEQFGEDLGDQALQVIAQAIADELHPEEYVARHGGEQFVVVLPAIDVLHVEQRAGQIYEMALASLRRLSRANHVTVTLTISAGHATFPNHASMPDSLLKAADLALYTAKNRGRNQLIGYSLDLLKQESPTLGHEALVMNTSPSTYSLPTGADLETLHALITAIDLRDGYTAAHSEGVSRYAVALGVEMGLPIEEIEALRLGGLIHDVGKIGVADSILRKAGKLDAEEWAQMQSHTTMGNAIVQPIKHLHHLLPLVRSHHERLDGSGYPDGLSGDQIPMLVRILGVADIFEAFTAERPYHPGHSPHEGLTLLQREAAQGRLDPLVVESMETILVCHGVIAPELTYDHDLLEAA